MVRIVREEYLGQLKSLVKTPDIKVITGIRRCGKSWLMADFIKWLKEYDPLSNIVFINLQDLQFESLKAYRTLNDYVMKQYQSDRNNYLVIDEVQLCESFELAINSIHSGGLFDIYITGSNAFLLSSDLLTLFTGRTINVEVFPFHSTSSFAISLSKILKTRLIVIC
ncbi:MAG TPA: AAA family ATPase [Anaerolineaceae bacterium]|nr:AAA family ATPase [Anaerolineaceae bacterium]